MDGGTGDDDMSGGAGIDTVTYASRSNAVNVTLDGNPNDGESGESDNVANDVEVIIGGAGNDTLDATGDNSSVTLEGGGGNDQLNGGNAGDSLSGGSGNDTMVGNGGGDTYDGGTGTDTADYSLQSSNLQISLDGVANDGPVGSATDNVLGNVEIIDGGTGDDTIDASAVSTSVTLLGNSGDDTLIGGSGADSISGGTGNDSVDGGLGGDDLSGGTGIDTLTYSDRSTNLDITLDGVANDGAGGENDNVHGDFEEIIGGTGNDTIDAMLPIPMSPSSARAETIRSSADRATTASKATPATTRWTAGLAAMTWSADQARILSIILPEPTR